MGMKHISALQKGFSLLEMCIVLGLVAVLAVGGSWYLFNAHRDIELRNDAQHFQVVASAASKFVAHYKFGGECLSAGKCVYSIRKLKDDGFLNKAFSEKFGSKKQQDMQLLVRVIQGNSARRVEAMLISYGGSDYSDSELARITANIGVMAGYIRHGQHTEVVGADGVWTTPASDWVGFPNPPKQGHMAALVSSSPQSGYGENLPVGTIVMWQQKQIPENWALCDGRNGTPNLMGRFVLASKPDQSGDGDVQKTVDDMKVTLTTTAAETGTVTIPSTMLTVGQLARTTMKLGLADNYARTGGGVLYEKIVPVPQPRWNVTARLRASGQQKPIEYDASFYGTNHSHTVDARPPYYKLEYIQKIK
ncbi:shufflon system plasmid conjugative transfer pilus tip adhesin PilV [Chromobacterium amazonense]|uniref:shufflon system plasmid conjugative transfer pilus tip adhesin PilV n=1 Tax=Chromobacterium amazonense TaxID=1382803 RepID=UPI003F7B23DD